MSTSQTALTYAAFIAADGKADGPKLQAICKAAGVEVSSGLAKMFAGHLAKKSLSDILANVALGGGGAAAAPAAGASAAPAAAAAPKKEEKKAESEGDDDMGFGLFD